jgi:hypothetical protein
MERVEVLEQKLAKIAATVPSLPAVMVIISPTPKAFVKKAAVKAEASQAIPARPWSFAKNLIG